MSARERETDREGKRNNVGRNKTKLFSVFSSHPAVRRRSVVLKNDLGRHVHGRARPRSQRRVGGRVADGEAKVGGAHGGGWGLSFRLLFFVVVLVVVVFFVGVEEEEVVRLIFVFEFDF